MSTAYSVPEASPSLPPPTSVLFARGIIARLTIWPALRIAVDQSWGGPNSSQKRTWLASIIVDDFEEQKDYYPDVDFVEDRLLQVLEDEFDVVLEDDSARPIAQEIVALWTMVHTDGGRALDVVQGLEEQADKVKGKKLQVEEGAANDSDWEDESGGESDALEDADEPPQLLDSQRQQGKPEPEVDEEGFTRVTGKGKSHR